MSSKGTDMADEHRATRPAETGTTPAPIAGETRRIKGLLEQREGELLRLSDELDRIEERVGPEALASSELADEGPILERTPDLEPTDRENRESETTMEAPVPIDEVGDDAVEETTSGAEIFAAEPEGAVAEPLTIVRDEALAAAVEDLRVRVINLDRKLELFASQVVDRLGEGAGRGGAKSATGRTTVGRDRARLGVMAAALGALILLWFLLALI